jgi:hypothetical protein
MLGHLEHFSSGTGHYFFIFIYFLILQRVGMHTWQAHKYVLLHGTLNSEKVAL